MSIVDDEADVTEFLEKQGTPKAIQVSFERFVEWAYGCEERLAKLAEQVNALRDAARVVRNLFIEK